jgi:hypothetical protein
MSIISLAISNITAVSITAPPAGGNVIPTPSPNWADIDFVPTGRTWTYNKQQIQGIDEVISLRLSSSANPNPENKIYINVSLSNPAWSNGGTSSDDPVTAGFTEVTSFPYDFTVQPNDYVSFAIWMQESGTYSYTMTVSNESDSGTVIDTFLADSSGSNVVPYPALDWANVIYDVGGLYYQVSKQQVNDITQPIDLKFISSPPISGGETIMLYISQTEPSWANGDVVFDTPSILGFNVINEGVTFTVNRGDWVSFAIESSIGVSVNYYIDVVNESDGDELLDAFTADVFGL